MKTIRDAEVRLAGDMLKKYETAVVLQEAREREASCVGSMHIAFDGYETTFQWPLPPNGLQRRFASSTVNEWVCFAPGYPAWEVMV